MKSILLFIILVLFSSTILYPIYINGDNVPPHQESDIQWTVLPLNITVQVDHLYNLNSLQTEEVKKQVITDYQEKEIVSVSQYCYDPYVIIYHGDDEYSMELSRLKGLDPGFPINMPEGMGIDFQGKYLDRSLWYYSIYFESTIELPRTGILYSLVKIELGNGTGIVPLVIIIDETNPSLTNRGVR